MKFLIRACLATAIVFAPIRTAAAQVVVVNGGAPNEGAGWNIFDDNRAAAAFKIGAVTFDAIRFWGLLPDGPTYTPDMYWEILLDGGSGPVTTVAASGHAVAGAVVRKELDLSPGFFSWQFDIAAGDHTLAGGVYWLALHDGPLDPTIVTGSTLIWETSDPPGEHAIQTFSIDDHWDVNPSYGLAFELLDSPVVTPEPASLWLMATGLCGLAIVRGRRRGK